MGLLSYAAVIAAAIAAAGVMQGKIQVPLPFPASNQTVLDIPAESLPQEPLPFEGALAKNDLLTRKAVKLFENVIKGSETVALQHGSDSLTMLDKFGYVWVAEPVPSATGGKPSNYTLNPEPLAYLGQGRPLGFHHDAQGNLIVCDSTKGLLMLEAGSRRLVVLSTRVSPTSPLDPGAPLNYVNDLDIAPDGTVYFSTSHEIPVAMNKDGFYDTFWSFLLGLYSGSHTGKLLKYEPATGTTTCLAKGFWYANGVALSEDGSYVALAETNRMRVVKVWIKGPKAGTTEPLISHLPGFPDGVSRSADGNFWVALPAPRSPLLKLLKFKLLRCLLPWLPENLKPPLPRWGAVTKVSPNGEVLQTLMDPDGSHIAFVSAVAEHEGRLFMGSVKQDYVGYYDL